MERQDWRRDQKMPSAPIQFPSQFVCFFSLTDSFFETHVNSSSPWLPPRRATSTGAGRHALSWCSAATWTTPHPGHFPRGSWNNKRNHVNSAPAQKEPISGRQLTSPSGKRAGRRSGAAPQLSACRRLHTSPWTYSYEEEDLLHQSLVWNATAWKNGAKEKIHPKHTKKTRTLDPRTRSTGDNNKYADLPRRQDSDRACVITAAEERFKHSRAGPRPSKPGSVQYEKSHKSVAEVDIIHHK